MASLYGLSLVSPKFHLGELRQIGDGKAKRIVFAIWRNDGVSREVSHAREIFQKGY